MTFRNLFIQNNSEAAVNGFTLRTGHSRSSQCKPGGQEFTSP
jgi:hypothetical protein